MNFLNELRSYIDTNVKAVDPNIEATKNDPYGDDDVSYNSSRFYKFVIGITTQVKENGYYQDNTECYVELYGEASNKSEEVFDEVYCKTLAVKNGIQSLQGLAQNEFFNTIEVGTVEPLPLDDDSKTIIVRLNFTAIRYINQ
jgi:hypothetical protein